jgi:hypothetical protein
MPYSLPVHSRPQRSHRPSLALRARVWLKNVELDATLAGGADPTGTEELALRAHQLAEPKKRGQLAAAIVRLIAMADRRNRATVIPSLAPFRPWQVEANRSLLLDLARRLRDQGPHPLQGVAMASLLLENGAGPLFFDDRRTTLERAVRACLSALDAYPREQ